MRVVLVSTTDITGGAARGTYRLHIGLRRIGIDSIMYVMYKAGGDVHTRKVSGTLKPIANKTATWLENKLFEKFAVSAKYCPWSMQIAPRFFCDDVLALNPDIVHLNGVMGFVPLGGLQKLQKPLVWTIVDMWPFTGGCHYSGTCEKFKSQCKECHLLNPRAPIDLAKLVWHRKARALRELNLTVAAISEWLLHCSQSSPLLGQFRNELVHYGIDENVYRPIDNVIAKNILGLETHLSYIAFGADGGSSNPRKGFDFTLRAMNALALRGVKNVGLLVFGQAAPETGVDCPYPVKYLGALNDDLSMALTYSAADVMLVPSTQEGFGQTALEAMSCGTPVVTFEGLGTCDIVDHLENGYISRYADVEDMATGIEWCLTQSETVGTKCRGAVLSEYTLEAQARRYEAIYKSLLQQ